MKFLSISKVRLQGHSSIHNIQRLLFSLNILHQNSFYKIPYDYKNHILYKWILFFQNHYNYHNMHKNIQNHHIRNRYFLLFHLFLVQNKNDIVFDDSLHFLHKRDTYSLSHRYHYMKYTLHSQNHHKQNTSLGIPQFFVFLLEIPFLETDYYHKAFQ